MTDSKSNTLDKLTVIAALFAVVISVFSLLITSQQHKENRAIAISEARANICLSFAQFNFARALENVQFMASNVLTKEDQKKYQKSINNFRDTAVKYQESAAEVINCLKGNDNKQYCATKVLLEGFNEC